MKTSSTFSARGSWTTFPQTIPSEYYAAIGEICARWSWLEFQLGVIARETLKINKPQGFSVFGGMSMRSISTALIALSLSGFPKNKPKINDAISKLGNKLYNIGDLRNEYAHAIWGFERIQNPNLGIWKFKSAKDRVSPSWVYKPIKKIQEDGRMLADLQVMAQEITDALKGRQSRFD